jgi:hypothetical protein
MRLIAITCLLALVMGIAAFAEEPVENPFYEDNLALYQEALALQGSLEVAATAHTRDDATNFGERQHIDSWPLALSELDLRFYDKADAVFDVRGEMLHKDRLYLDSWMAGDHVKGHFNLARQRTQNANQAPIPGFAWSLSRHLAQDASLELWLGHDREFAVGVSEYSVDRQPLSNLAVDETTRRGWMDYLYQRGEWEARANLWVQQRNEPQIGMDNAASEGLDLALAWQPTDSDRLSAGFRRVASDTADLNAGELGRNDFELEWNHRFGGSNPIGLRTYYERRVYEETATLNSHWGVRNRYGLNLRTSAGDVRLLEGGWKREDYSYERLTYEVPGVTGLAYVTGLTPIDWALFYDPMTVKADTWYLNTRADLGNHGAWFAGGLKLRRMDDTMGTAPIGTIALRRDRELSYNALFYVPITPEVALNLDHTYSDWDNGPSGGHTSLFGAALNWTPCERSQFNVRYNRWSTDSDYAAGAWNTDADSLGATYSWQTDNHRGELFCDWWNADGLEQADWWRLGGELRWGDHGNPWRVRLTYAEENADFLPIFDNSDLEILVGYTFMF